MENLARSRNCNEDERERVNAIINQELLSAGIEIISENGAGEVPYNIIGKLGPYEFRRAWYYWMVSGLVPYDAAVEMYENEYGKKTFVARVIVDVHILKINLYLNGKTFTG